MFNYLFNLFKIFWTFLITFVGFIIVIWFIWIRFIRERLPKDIPFSLTELGFYILIYICFIYLYISLRIIKPKEANSFITKIIELLFVPLDLFDNSFKHNKYIYPYYHTFIKFYINRYNNFTYEDLIILYFCFRILPRLLLISIFIFDIFIIHKISLFYSFILLNIFPLLYRYIIYSLKKAKKHITNQLNTTYKMVLLWDINWGNDGWEYNEKTMEYHDKYLTIDDYILMQLDVRYKYDENDVVYEAHPFPHEHVFNEYSMVKYNNTDTKLTKKDYAKLEENFYFHIPILIDLTIMLNAQSNISHSFYLKYLNLLIYSSHFVCWSSILYLSYDSVKQFPLTLILLNYIKTTILPAIFFIIDEKIDPFSGIILSILC